MFGRAGRPCAGQIRVQVHLLRIGRQLAGEIRRHRIIGIHVKPEKAREDRALKRADFLKLTVHIAHRDRALDAVREAMAQFGREQGICVGVFWHIAGPRKPEARDRERCIDHRTIRGQAGIFDELVAAVLAAQDDVGSGCRVPGKRWKDRDAFLFHDINEALGGLILTRHAEEELVSHQWLVDVPERIDRLKGAAAQTNFREAFCLWCLGDDVNEAAQRRAGAATKQNTRRAFDDFDPFHTGKGRWIDRIRLSKGRQAVEKHGGRKAANKEICQQALARVSGGHARYVLQGVRQGTRILVAQQFCGQHLDGLRDFIKGRQSLGGASGVFGNVAVFCVGLADHKNAVHIRIIC